MRTFDSFTNTCTCDPSYVDVGVAVCSLCSSVIPGCIICSSITICTTCSSVTHYRPSTVGTVCECVPGYYYDSVILACSLCDYTCDTCNGVSTSCTGCPTASSRTLNTINSCPCNSGYTDTGVPVCQSCSSLMTGCLVCSAPAVCTNCDVNFQVNALHLCECQPGYYLHLMTSSCLPCHYSCDTCVTLSTHCMSCPTGSHRSFAPNTCACDPGYTNVGVTVCQSCSSLLTGCLTCSSSAACTGCDTVNHYVLSLATNTCYCASGYYFDTIGGNCQPCSYSCLTCDVLASNCTTCLAHRSLTTMNTCPCDPGYTETGVAMCPTCLSLMAGCLFCSSSIVCTTCDSTNYFQLSATTHQCSCIVGYYYASGTRTCVSCSTLSSACTSCFSSSICTNCVNGYSLVAGACHCPVGKYVSGSLCLLCPSTCTVCTIAGCSSCVSGYYATAAAVCDEICGDGRLFVLPCDDGNLIDGDGCSSTCQIETNFACVNGTAATPSVCSYTLPFNIELDKITKKLTSN